MYTDDFKKAVHKDIIRRMDEDKNFELEVDNLCQTLGEDKTRNIAYEEYAKKPEFKQYLEEKGTFSQFGDDVSNLGKAWSSGDFLGHFQSIARSGITGDYQSQEKAYQNYKKWAEANPQPKGKTWLGKVSLGVANQLNLLGDMQPEAFATALSTGATAAGIASATNAIATPVIGAPTTLGAGFSGASTGYTLSNIKQGYEIGYADAFTALRDEGIDTKTANDIAGAVAIPYSLLELLKLKYIPGIRRLVGGNTVAEIVSKIADDKIKNKVIRAFTKRGIDLGMSTAVGTATEVAQRGMTEVPKYLAKGDSVNWNEVGNAMYEEGKAVFPTMLGMGGLGTVVDIATTPKSYDTDIENLQKAIDEGKKILDEEKSKADSNFIPVPEGVKLGAVFTGADGKTYKNVDGRAVPFTINTGDEESSTSNLDADAESESDVIPTKQSTESATIEKELQVPQQQPANNPTMADVLNGVNLPSQTQEQSTEQAYSPQIINDVERQNLEYKQEKKLETEKKLQAESELEDYIEHEIELQKELEKQKKKREKKARELKNKLNRKNNVSDSIAKIDRLDYRLDAMDQVYEFGDVDKLTDDQLFEAYENGLDWAEKEIQKREEASGAGITLLEAMREGGYKLPTPAAIIRHAKRNNRGLSTYLYGEIKDLYDSLPKDKQLKYFSRNYTNTDEFAEELADYGFKYDSEGDFIADVAENLSGRKVSTGMKFSLSNSDYSAMSDQELIDAHAKAERVNDIDNGRAITDEWLKRKGYNIDVYHGSSNHNINEFKEESYFTKNEDYAKRYKRGENGKIYETKLNLKKPFDTRNPQERAIFENEFYRNWGNGAPLSERGLPDWTDGSDLLEFLDENGYDYDGILLDEGADGGYGEAVNQRGESYVPRNASQIKSRDAFTYDDDGKYIPLDKRGDIKNPDIRFSINEGDAQRFRDELQDYIDGKLDNRHIFRLGTTPEAMRLCGAKDIPLELTASTLSTKEAKHSLKLQTLKDLPVEIADPIAIFQSSQIPDGLVVLTELKDDDNNQIVVAVHLEKKRNRNLVNDIRSIHGRSDYNIQTQIDRGLLLYLNTIRKPYSLRPNRVPPVGGSVNKASYGSKIFTQEDLSQEEKENIFKLRGENPQYKYSVSDGNFNSKAESIKQEVLNIKSKFDKKAKYKSNVEVVGTVQEAREFFNTRNIPYDARGIQTGEKIVLVAENLDDTETGARVFLHEQVGHFGLRGLLGKDLRPFLNYVIKHYEGTKAWNKIASKKEYAKQGKYAIAEEMLAHLAENRELSDPSMWKRLVHRVKRAIWGNGVPQEYVNLLDEEVLRSAIVLSREWAKGDHYLNANGVWESVKNTRRAKDLPEEENFSLNDSETQKQYDGVVAKYKGTPLWMKAPNGQPTKLTEEQWVMVRTPNFKKWFGDWENDPANASKVVDDNGEPLVVYHGTNAEFNAFDSKRGNPANQGGLYFSNIRSFSSKFGKNIKEVFLDIKNPNLDGFNGNGAVMSRSEYRDGGIFTKRNTDGYAEEGTKEYIVFNPTQIKSATDNVGTYDSANEDIRFSYNETRSQAELDELNAKFRDLYEQYKNGDQDAYQQAVELVKAEAERKGYAVKVYHGTGADGFNVAKADSSEEQNGEGNQAHGAGLYMAVSRDTAERYQSRAEKDTYYVIAGKKISEYGFDDLGLSKGYIYEIFTVAKSGGVEREIKEYESLLKLKKGFLEDLKESLPEQQKDPDFSMMMFNSAVQSYEFDINRYKKVIEGLEHLQNVLEENGLDESDIELVETEGHLFNWLTNLNDDNTLDEDWAIYQHEKPVQEAYKKAYEEDILPILKESYGFDEDELESANRAFDTSREVGDIVRSARTYIGADKFREIMLKHGIKGLTYDGRQDGRCYVSFEGGATIKLQDPFTFDDNGELIPLSERFNEGNADMRFSLEDSKPREKYDGRFGKAERKYKKLLGQKSKELERHIEYDDLPDIATDDEFKSVVGMTKKEYADLMHDRDRVANEMRHEYQKTGQKFKQAQVDRYNPIKIIERIMNGGDLLGAEKSAYKSLFTAGNMDAVMYNAIYVGLPQYDRKSGTYKIRKGYKPLIQYFEKVKGEKYDNFQNYAQAVAMLEHYARSHNLETIEDALKWADSKEFEGMAGFSKVEAQKWIDEATQDSKDTVDALQELFKANREFMVETGLASAKQADILNSFDYYLPMLRQFEDADTILSGDGGGYKSRGFSGRTSGVNEFVGSKAKIKNVMESIIERSAALYANGYKNVAMQRNIQMLSEFGLAKHAMKASVRVQARIEQAKNALEREGIKVENVRDESELIPLEAFHIINSLDEQVRDNIVSVRSNGNLIFYHIADPELLVALKSLGAEQQKLITSLFTGAKNIMTWGVTKLPAFAVRNFLRDTGSNAIILGNNPAKSVVNFAKSMKDTPQMQKIRMAGMGGAFWYPVSSAGATLDFGDGAWKKTKRIGKYILTPFRAYDRILQASEQANRITAYDKAIAEGLSEAESAFRASDVLNFGMSGSGVWTGKNYYAKSAMEILSWLIRISPFVNAGIQGLFKAYREAGFEKGFFDAKDEFSKKAKAKKVMQALNKSLLIRGAILASASVLYSIYANSSEDDDGEKWYEKLSDDEKLSYWHFYMGDNKILRLPKPFEIGYLFSTIPTAMTDAMLQDNPETAKLLWRGMTDQLRFDFASNPIIDTAIENWRNKDSFRKTPIVERSDLNLPSQMQYSADTTSTAKALSIIPNMIPLLRDTWASSPARVQNMLDNFFGGMSQYGTYLTDSIVESFSSIEGGTSRYARKTPVERAYEWSLRDTRTMRYKNAEQFYELKGRIDELYASARLYKQTQQLDKLQELIDENTAEFGSYEIVNALNTKLREIATKRRKLGETKTYSVDEMIELDDKLLAERNKLLNYTDIIIERIEKGEYNQRDLREIKKRIDNAGKSKKESKKADRILKGLR